MWTFEFHIEAAEELVEATDWSGEQNPDAEVRCGAEVRDVATSTLSDPLWLPSRAPEQYFYLLK